MELKNKKGNKRKFYVVFQGIEPGIYQTWEDCAPHVIVTVGVFIGLITPLMKQ